MEEKLGPEDLEKPELFLGLYDRICIGIKTAAINSDEFMKQWDDIPIIHEEKDNEQQLPG